MNTYNLSISKNDGNIWDYGIISDIYLIIQDNSIFW